MTEKVAFTVESVTAAMEKAVAERGEDWVYPKYEDGWDHMGGCRYFHAETHDPACIVGFVINEHGWTEDEATAAFLYRSDGVEGLRARALLDGLSAPPAVVHALSAAQAEQDECEPWGKALSQYRSSIDGWLLS